MGKAPASTETVTVLAQGKVAHFTVCMAIAAAYATGIVVLIVVLIGSVLGVFCVEL